MKNGKKILIIVIVLLLPVIWYVGVDGKNLYVDIYNFRQLSKAKIILKDLDREDEQFFYLKDFNEIYSEDIQPIKNCYYVRSYKGEDRVPYTFGFKLESYVFLNLYGTEFYAYPKYDLPYQNFCMGGFRICEEMGNCDPDGGCFDTNRKAFEDTISNPCRDN